MIRVGYEIIDCEQGSPDWFMSRLGQVTASVASRVVTKTGRLSSQANDVINRAVAELVMNEPDDFFVSDTMIRGQELESEALAFFNFTYGYDFKPAGFIKARKSVDDGEFFDIGYGCSPDGLDEEKRIGIEMKCPLAHTHLAYLVDKVCPDVYFQQVQTALLVTGFPHWAFGSYHPDFPSFLTVVERDEPMIRSLREHLSFCGEEIQRKLKILKEELEA